MTALLLVASGAAAAAAFLWRSTKTVVSTANIDVRLSEEPLFARPVAMAAASGMYACVVLDIHGQLQYDQWNRATRDMCSQGAVHARGPGAYLSLEVV